MKISPRFFSNGNVSTFAGPFFPRLFLLSFAAKEEVVNTRDTELPLPNIFRATVRKGTRGGAAWVIFRMEKSECNASLLVLLLRLLDLTQLEELLIPGTFKECIQRLFATYIFRFRAEVIAIAANTANNTCALHALCKPAYNARRIFVVVSLNLYIYHRWGRIA